MFEVGNIAARLTGVFSDDGFKKFGKAYDDSSAKAKKPVEAELGAKVNKKGFDEAKAKVDEFGAKKAAAALDVDTRKAEVNILKLQGAITILEGRIDEHRAINLDTGVAEAQLALLKNRLRDLNKEVASSGLTGDLEGLGLAIEDLGAKAGGGSGGSGGAAGELGSLGESMPSLASAAVALAPVLLGLGGAIGAVAGSAGAAAGGAGAVGAGAFGALAVGLGSVFVVAKPLLSEFQNLTKAQAAYGKIVKQYGSDSKQAAAGQKTLNAAIAANGGSQMTKIITNVKELGKAWKEATKPATHSLTGVITSGIQAARTDLPAVSKDVNANVQAFAGGATNAISSLQRGGITGILGGLSATFQRNIGPALDAVTKSFLAFGRVAVAAGPYVSKLASYLDDLATKFNNASKGSHGFSGLISTMVGHLSSWLKLIGAAGRALGVFFTAGASSGKGLVDNLTTIINKFADWEQSLTGSKAIQKFFSDSSTLTKNFLAVLAPLIAAVFVLVRSAMPGLNEAFKILKPVAEAIFVIINDLNSVLGGKFVSYLFAVIGAIKAWTIAQTALDLVLDANPVGVVVVAIGALVLALVEAWKHSETFRTVVTAVFLAVKVIISQALNVILGGFTTLLGMFQKVLDLASHIPGIGGKFHDLSDAVGKAKDSVDKMRESLRKNTVEAAGHSLKIQELKSKYDDAKAAQDKLKKGTDDYRQAAELTKQRADDLAAAVKGTGTSADNARQPLHTVAVNIQGLGDVARGTASQVINDLNTALTSMGAKPLSVKVSAPTAAGQLGAPAGGHLGALPGFVSGGVPNPGSGSRDDHVLVDPSGRPVAAMSGTEGILNRPQMGIVDYALGGMASMGLLPSNLGGLNALWSAGMQHFAGGGVMERANSLDAMHLPYVWGGHHGDRGPITDPRPGLDCSSTVSYVLGIPPRVSSQFENFGKAGDTGPIVTYANASHVFMRIGSRYFGTSLSNPGGGPGWIPARSGAGFTARSTPGSGLGSIDAPAVSGSNRVAVALGQAAGKKLSKAANSYLNTKLAAFDNAAGDPQEIAAGGSGSGETLMRSISKAMGWNFADWWAVDARETGHGTNETNPTSTARLRGQFLSSNWGKYGPGSDPAQHPTMDQQIQSMAQYISARYGNPTAAEAHENSFGWYKGGGSLLRRFAGGGALAGIPHFNGGGSLGRPPNVSSTVSGTIPTGTGSDPYGARTLRRQQVDHIGAYDALLGTLGDEQRTYSQTDRKFGQSTEILIDSKTGELNQAAIDKRATELNSLLKIRQRIVSIYEQAQRIARRVIKTYTELISRLTASLKHAKNKDRSGIRSSINQYSVNRDEWRGKLHDLGFDLTDAKLDVDDIRKEGGELRGTVASPVADTTPADTSSSASSGAAGAGGITSDQQALLDQAATLKQIVSTGNFINTAALQTLSYSNPALVGSAAAPSSSVSPPAVLSGTSTPGSAAFTASGAPAVGGSPTVIFQSYVPPTPQQAHQLGQYVTTGLSYQGSINSPRESLGI